MDYCTLYIVRHGETEWNVQGLIQGHQGSPLTAEGKEQVQALAGALRNIYFDAVYSSDLIRAKDTAAMIAVERQLAVRTTEALRERGYGTFEGRRKEEFDRATMPLLKQFSELFNRESNSAFLDQHGIEDDQAVAGRVITFLREIAVVHSSQNVLVVTHGGVMRTLLTHLGFLRHDQLFFDTIGNTAYVKLKSDGVEFFLEEVQGIQGIEKKGSN